MSIMNYQSTLAGLETVSTQQNVPIAGAGGQTVLTVIVYPAGYVKATGISLTQTSLTLNQNDSVTLSAAVTPANASNKAVTWTCSNQDVATVDNAGKISAIYPGIAKITATSQDGGGSASCTVTVNTPLPPTITAIPGQTITINTGTTAIPFTVGDSVTPLANLTLAASSSAAALVPPENIVFGGSGANRTVSVTPAAGQSGSATIAIQVSNSLGLSTSTSFTVTVQSPTRNFIVDRNNNGISDIWEALYPTAGAPDADPDGDGVPNRQEALAGTDPTNPASGFAALSTRDASGNLVVRWPSIAGKYYFVDASTDLATWTALPGEYTGTGAELSAIVRPAGTVGGPRAFWHVVVFDADSTGSSLNDWEKTHPEAVASITVTDGANGSISPTGVSYVAKGGNLSYGVTPAAGYSIDQVQVDGQSVGAVSTYNFSAITSGSHTIGATFKPIATNLAITKIQGSSAHPGWPDTNAIDGNLGTCWSSNLHPLGQGTDSLAYWLDGYHPVNFIKLRPRFTDRVLGFPMTFSVSWSDGTNWVPTFTKTNYPTPTRDGWVIFPLPATVNANGIYIVATQLGNDGGSNVFQMAEVGAGYDLGFQSLVATVTASASAYGSISPSGSALVAKGDNITYSITPSTGCVIGDVQVDGQSVGAVSTYTFNTITGGPHTIVATFKSPITDWPVTNMTSGSAIWPALNAIDGNIQTCWSSNVHSSAANTEWIAYWFDGYHPVNYIKLRPRFGGAALGFPVEFTVYWSDGNWQWAFAKSSYPKPTSDGWVILPLPATVNANGIHIIATQLGGDNTGVNYVFQLAEVGAGYDSTR